MEINRLPFGIHDICRVLAGHAGFYFARFSDGGFQCLWRAGGENCEGIAYTDAQADALEAVLNNPRVTHGLAEIAVREARAMEWITEHRLEIPWYEENALLNASMDGELWPVTELLLRRRILMVGPPHLRRFKGFPLVDFVEVHPTQAFDRIDQTKADISNNLRRRQIDTVLISAGFAAAPVLVAWLADHTDALVVFDIGSVWDMYVGELSRSGPKRLGRAGVERVGQANFHQAIGSWWG